MKKAEKMVNDVIKAGNAAKKASKNLEDAKNRCWFYPKDNANLPLNLRSGGHSYFEVVENQKSKIDMLSFRSSLCLVGIDDILKFKEWLNNMLDDAVIATMKDIKERQNDE